MTPEQYELIDKKYGKLIHKIGHWISGDNATTSHEDNTQDVWIAAIEAIRGYEKKENQTFDEFWGTKGFDKYIKTCLWNCKNSKGAKITKKASILKGTVDVVGNQEVLRKEDNSVISPETGIFIEEIKELLSSEEQELVSTIIEDPKYIKPSGKLNILGIANKTGKSWNDVSKCVTNIGNKVKNHF